jgi:hypothetical protein
MVQYPCYVLEDMEARKRYRIFYTMGYDVLIGLGIAFLLAIPLSPNLWTLTNNCASCIVCLYTAYKFAQYREDE